MQIVINVSNTLKNLIDQNDLKTLSHAMWQSIMIDAIKNGIPLPKGHGALKDENTIQIPYDICDGNEAMEYIHEAPTIIEADKEVQDER